MCGSAGTVVRARRRRHQVVAPFQARRGGMSACGSVARDRATFCSCPSRRALRRSAANPSRRAPSRAGGCSSTRFRSRPKRVAFDEYCVAADGEPCRTAQHLAARHIEPAPVARTGHDPVLETCPRRKRALEATSPNAWNAPPHSRSRRAHRRRRRPPDSPRRSQSHLAPPRTHPSPAPSLATLPRGAGLADPHPSSRRPTLASEGC